jgi:hypothetical protein
MQSWILEPTFYGHEKSGLKKTAPRNPEGRSNRFETVLIDSSPSEDENEPE